MEAAVNGNHRTYRMRERYSSGAFDDKWAVEKKAKGKKKMQAGF